ncbi:LLM class flavin-dependent oxidoreductase [Sphingomonas naphthae]|uniref:LLM class flavin-dependent oxidoreductase n=1 Tax=Sphingomonas naphthae TaxID=1813468 RepID=A0ABY7TMT3_9SPHN|nr:LLM class flavin-dependent oxidoreductase [Sphingomonas naphthae]WCT74479.1 LLM class flavin-dependent oxidoreductase [Sphingomonas naphthae]
MKFGLFGGASASTTQDASDSMQGLDGFTAYVEEADRLGYYGLFLVEHHFMGTGQISSALSLLAYLAGRTKNIRLGTGVVVLPWHNPVLVAEQVATIDQLSKGRFDFGIGRGYRPNEFACFRVSMEEAHRRYEETYAFLRRAWMSDQRFNHRGEFWSFDDVVIDPPVVQRPHPPMWVGAASEASIARAGREGLNLLLDQIGTPDVVAERIRIYRQAVEQSGRTFQPASVGVTRALHLVANDQEWRAAHELRAKLREQLRAQAGSGSSSFATDKLKTFSDSSLTIDEAALIGYPHEVADKIAVLRDAGVDYVLLADITGSQDSLRIFAEQIMPRFADAAPAKARAA